MSFPEQCSICLAQAEPDGEGGKLIRHSPRCHWRVDPSWEKPRMKFRLNQMVWVLNGPGSRAYGVIREAETTVEGNWYGVEMDKPGELASWREENLMPRGVVERIGGLAKVRQQMAEDELVADQAAREDYSGCLGVPEDEWTAEQLQDYYDHLEQDGKWGEHPRFPMTQWRQEVADCSTRVGYWEWVSYCLNE